jgi:tRNA nucleotidyltransferase/poly(A) polymerase
VLRERGVFVPTTAGNQERGTLAMKVGGHRLEITSFRAGDAAQPMAARIAADLAERDMTIGAIAIELATDRVHDPHDGMRHWRERRGHRGS